MSTQGQPAALNHLEVLMTALLQRSMQDDVPTDVHRQIYEAHRKFTELQATLTAEPPKKNLFNRKK